MRATAFAVIALLAAGCGHASPPVSLSDQWPSKAEDYDDATDAWTRSGTIHAPMSEQGDQLLEVFATFKSPEWRAAYVAHRAKLGKLPSDARQRLVDEQKKADADSYEVQLIVATYYPRDNDLQKGTRSIWRVALVGDGGQEIEASEIKRDRRPPEEIRAEFPHMSEFHESYVARFPRDVALLGPDARKIKLKMSSLRGVVELTWRR